MACLESIPISETDPPNPNFTRDFDSLSLPSLDTDFFSDDFALPDNLMTDLGFDLDFSFDDFILPAPGNEGFVAADGSQVLSSSLVSVDTSGFPSSPQEPKVTDKLGVSFSSQVSRNHVASLLNSPSREIGSCNRDSSGAVLSEDSAADCRTAVSGTKVLNSPSPDGGLSGCVPSPNSNSSNIKLDQVRNKRRKEKEDGTTNNPRSSKIRRSILSDDDDANSTTYTTNNTDIEQEAKRKARLMRNRESAQLSRQRKKHYVEELEDKIRSMHSTITELNGKISFIMAENASLRQQLVGGGVCQPPSVIYPPPPMPAMPYHPWLPCASYLMKPQGSQLPLLPIPRLKPRQQPISASKPNKSETKIKKVASVTFLGLLFFILVFGGLVPFGNVKYGGNKETDSSGLQFSNNRFHSHPRGRVLTVSSRFNGSDHNNVGVSFNPKNSGFGEGHTQSIHGIRGRSKGAKSNVKQNQFGSQPLPALVRPVRLGNGSEPLVASLYVPRNDKLVKIDGNLIIHSILASEKAMKSSHATREVKSDRATVSLASEAKENSFAIANNLATTFVVSQAGRNAGRHPHMYRNPNKQQKALTGDTFKEKSKGATADGSHQWFREGLAGPILSSGMCTEVFEFNVSPDSANPGAIIPATAVANISAEHPPDSAQPRKRKNKRILYHSPVPLAGSIVNKTEENDERPSNNIQGNKAVSSMVVSVLVDPRESGDADGAGVISSKSLSRIFVVVLIDSVKYVTYSCVLPHKGSSSHLITT